MIKCFGFGKLLKQLFIISLISCFGLLGNSFVNARTYTGNSNRLAYQSVGDREYLDNYGFLTDEYSNFDTFYNSGTDLLVLYYPPYGGSLGRQIYGWIDGKLYYYGDYNGLARYKTQGFIKNFMKTTKEDLFDINSSDNPYRNYHNNLTANEFYSLDLKFTNIYTMSTFGSQNALASLTFRTFCLEEENGEDIYCWSCNATDNQGTPIYTCLSDLENSNNYDISDFDSLSSISFDFSPFTFGSSSGGNNEVVSPSGPEDYNYFELTGDDLVNYFENSPFYKFNKNICYVGIDDLNVLYGSGGSFREGEGKTIFDLYGAIYGSGLNNTFKTNQVGAFINTWWINYDSRFNGLNRDGNGDIIYNAIYNISGVSLDYSDNLINPFVNNRLAIYFMASEVNSFGNVSTPGEEIAVYCYHKFNQDGIGFGDYSIIDEHNSSFDDNASDFIENWNRYSYKSGSIIIESQSRDGTILDNFTGDDNLDFSTFFSKTFNKWKDTFNISNEDLGAGFLPTYIIMFLLALVLFRFLSH